MEVCNPKGGRTAALASILTMLIMIMMLLNTYCCGAAVLAKSNTSFRCSSGRLSECLIEEDLELELGFLMNPYVSRILGGNHGSKSSKSLNKDHAAFDTKACGKPGDISYNSCIMKIPKPAHTKCDKENTYNRCPPN